MAKKQKKKQAAPAQRKRKTTHEVACECGSMQVQIDNTKSRKHPWHLETRVIDRKQYFVCRDCGRRWWRKLKVTEQIQPEK